MANFYYPLEVMQLRTQAIQSNFSASYGRVRNNQTTNHQGWDLFAVPGTRCYAIAAGVVAWTRNGGSYGQQLGIQFNRDGSDGASRDPLLAFYAHLRPGSIAVSVGERVGAGQLVALTGISGNASAAAPHLHFEIRRIGSRAAGFGLANRIDPGVVLGYELYNSLQVQIGGRDAASRMSMGLDRATPVR